MRYLILPHLTMGNNVHSPNSDLDVQHIVDRIASGGSKEVLNDLDNIVSELTDTQRDKVIQALLWFGKIDLSEVEKVVDVA